jgi:putrescine aminotransferase
MKYIDRERLVELNKKHLIHPNYSLLEQQEKGPVSIMTRGEGIYLWEANGDKYLDGTAGLWLSNIGHARKEMAEVAKQQMETLEYFSSFFGYSNQPSIELAARVTKMAPEGLNRILFTQGGSEAIESAFKIASYYQHLRGKPQKRKIIARDLAYHGMAWAGTRATGIPVFHKNLSLELDDIIRVPAPYPYRQGDVDPVKDLEKAIAEHGPENISAFIGEPVIGAGGAIAPLDDYWLQVQEICRKNDILFILDEVICGFGRTGKWFGAEQWNLKPDLMTVAKGMTSGYAPLGGVLVHDQVYEVLLTSDDPFAHGYTYSGHPTSCAIAMKNLDILEEEDLVENAKIKGEKLLEGLKQLESSPIVGEVRGIGLIFAIELVRDKETKRPIQIPDFVIFQQFLDRRLITRIAGSKIILSPPFILTDEDVQKIIQIVGSVIEKLETRA